MNRMIAALLVAGCAAPGSGVHEMTAAGHESAAAREKETGSMRASAQHRASADELRKIEADACAGLSDPQRATSPLARSSVVAVKQLRWWIGEQGPDVLGASIIVRGDPAVSHGQLQRLLTCHIAHAQLAGGASDDPLAVAGISATVRPFGPGFAVDIMSDAPGSREADELWRRASRLGPVR